MLAIVYAILGTIAIILTPGIKNKLNKTNKSKTVRLRDVFRDKIVYIILGAAFLGCCFPMYIVIVFKIFGNTLRMEDEFLSIMGSSAS